MVAHHLVGTVSFILICFFLRLSLFLFLCDVLAIVGPQGLHSLEVLLLLEFLLKLLLLYLPRKVGQADGHGAFDLLRFGKDLLVGASDGSSWLDLRREVKVLVDVLGRRDIACALHEERIDALSAKVL